MKLLFISKICSEITGNWICLLHVPLCLQWCSRSLYSWLLCREEPLTDNSAPSDCTNRAKAWNDIHLTEAMSDGALPRLPQFAPNIIIFLSSVRSEHTDTRRTSLLLLTSNMSANLLYKRLCRTCLRNQSSLGFPQHYNNPELLLVRLWRCSRSS